MRGRRGLQDVIPAPLAPWDGAGVACPSVRFWRGVVGCLRRWVRLAWLVVGSCLGVAEVAALKGGSECMGKSGLTRPSPSTAAKANGEA